MTRFQIERVANAVLNEHDCDAPPIDVFVIARAEGIELAAGNYGEDFCGRIEFHSSVGKFLLFYPDLTEDQYPARVRFSVAHELGHYFLDQHRELLIRGAAHNSTSDFICEDQLEREADEFAAALLIPGALLKRRLTKRSFMTLAEILQTAQDCHSSATSAAIRYAQCTTEACIVVVSERDKILFWVPSEEAAAIGFKFLTKERRVPIGSPTANIRAVHREVRGGTSSSRQWFPMRAVEVDLWEEAYTLGRTGRILTLLAMKN